MKMMQGAFFFPCSNRSRTREAPTPTNISTKSAPEMEKNGTPASPATARASSVLPVPGGPMSSTPFGMRPPRRVNLFGSLRKEMISSSSCFDSSMPATSENVTLLWCSVMSVERPVGLERRVVAERAVVVEILDLDLADLARLDLRHELRPVQGLRLVPALLEQLPERDEHHDEEHPEQGRLVGLSQGSLTPSVEPSIVRNRRRTPPVPRTPPETASPGTEVHL